MIARGLRETETMDPTNLPHFATVASAAAALAVMWLYLPRNRQLWLGTMLLVAAAFILNVLFKV
jgi:hypothetical protein